VTKLSTNYYDVGEGKKEKKKCRKGGTKNQKEKNRTGGRGAKIVNSLDIPGEKKKKKRKKQTHHDSVDTP